MSTYEETVQANLSLSGTTKMAQSYAAATWHPGFVSLASMNIKTGIVLKYTDVVGNKNAFSFIIKLRPQFNASDVSTTDKYVFKFYASGDTSDYALLYFDESDSDWVFTWNSPAGTSITLRTQDAQRFLADKTIELSGWIETEGRDIDGTTYYGKLFISGLEVDASTTQPTALASNPDILYIGSDGSDYWVTSELCEAALFTKALLDDEIKRHFYRMGPMLNDNGAWALDYTLASQDIVVYNAGSSEVELFDEGSEALSSVGHLASGRNPSVRGGRNEESTLYFPVAAGEVKVVYRPHWR